MENRLEYIKYKLNELYRGNTPGSSSFFAQKYMTEIAGGT